MIKSVYFQTILFIMYIVLTHSLGCFHSKIRWTNFSQWVASQGQCFSGFPQQMYWSVRKIKKFDAQCLDQFLNTHFVVIDISSLVPELVFLRPHQGRRHRTIPECPGMNYSPSSACLCAVRCASSFPVTLTCPRWPGLWLLWSQDSVETFGSQLTVRGCRGTLDTGWAPVSAGPRAPSWHILLPSCPPSHARHTLTKNNIYPWTKIIMHIVNFSVFSVLNYKVD